ncbi:hypothetical protein ES703_119031 [subsurface metagenome]
MSPSICFRYVIYTTKVATICISSGYEYIGVIAGIVANIKAGNRFIGIKGRQAGIGYLAEAGAGIIRPINMATIGYIDGVSIKAGAGYINYGIRNLPDI